MQNLAVHLEIYSQHVLFRPGHYLLQYIYILNCVHEPRAPIPKCINLGVRHARNFVVLLTSPPLLIHMVEIQRHSSIDENAISQERNADGIAHHVPRTVFLWIKLGSIR